MIKVLIARVSVLPYPFASVGSELTLVVKENPLPRRSRNMRFAALVNLLGLAVRVRSAFSLTGPIPAKE